MAFSPSSCEICFDNFIGQQTNLFVLSCSHPICELCVKSICIDQSIVCPVCWKMTQLHANSGSFCSRNRNSIDGKTGATTMLQESLVSRHVPIQEKKTQNEEEQILVLKIENGSCRFQRMTEMAIEKNERKVGNLNAVCKEVICHRNNDLIKQQENGNPVEMEIVNGKLRLKVQKDQNDQPSKCSTKDISLPKTDLKTTEKNEYGNVAAAVIETGRNEKGENLKATGSTSNQETNFENRKDSNPLTPILQPVIKDFFIPKFGAHKSPSKHHRVKVMTVFDPCRMYVQIVDDDLRRLDSLSKQLQLQLKPLSKNALRTSAIRNPIEGCVCAVLIGGFWQRGIVQSQIVPETVHQNVQVMAVDTGFCCLVPPPHIQPLHPIYMELPAQAVRCKLSDILRFELKDSGKLPLKNVHGYWPPRAMDLIQTKQDKMAELSVFDLVSGVVGSTPRTCEATLLVTMVVDGEPTSVNQQIDDAIAEAVLAKNGCHTNKLVLQTVTSTTAKAPRRRTRAHSKTNRSRIPETHFVASASADVPGDIRVVVKTVSPSRSTSNNCQSSAITRHSETNCQEKRETEQKGKPLRMDMWTFADVKATLPNCFDGVVTWVDESGGLFFHDCKWSKQLTLIRNTLNAAFNRLGAIKGDIRCQPEDSCLVKYESNWYRAIIRAVKKERKTATVFFIDYGATVDVKLTDIRMDTTLKNIPAHTFRCSLYDLVPAAAGTEKFDVGATWPDTVINYFHATVVNQEFNMTVKCYSPLIIAMRLLKNSMDLTDFMVTARAGDHNNQS